MKVSALFSLGVLASTVACTPLSQRAAAIHNTTSYAPSKGFWTLDINNSGYTDKQLTSTSWQVNVDSNAVTTPQRIESIALLRAAELGQQNGFSFFKILNKKAGLTCASMISGGVSSAPMSGSPSITVTAEYAKSQEQGFDSIDGYIAAHAAAVKSYTSTLADREATHNFLRAACNVVRDQR